MLAECIKMRYVCACGTVSALMSGEGMKKGLLRQAQPQWVEDSFVRYTMPWAIMALATFMKPATLAPFT